MIWDLIKDLNVDISDETVATILKKLTPQDWEKVKKELNEATENNLQVKRTVDLINRLIDIVVTRGIETILL